ncbi:MAG: hypothetical protein KDK91_07610 [Gammaproteobacteria bacterium]|nr:hypothetical protein [Gammaproteobacteria bacterium]
MKDQKHTPEQNDVAVRDVEAGEMEAVVGGLSLSRTAFAPQLAAKSTLKVDARLGDYILNGACDCCKWEPAIV